MKWCIFCFVLFAYLVALSAASIICTNDLTKEEYAIEDKEIFYRIINFTQIYENNMSVLNEDLQFTSLELMNNTKNLEKHLDLLTSQFLNRIANINNQLLNLADKMNKRLDGIMDVIVRKPVNCKEAVTKTHKSGIYEIQFPEYGSEPFKVFCENELFGGKWTVVMRRVDGSVDFYRNWNEYKEGFGNLSKEFFIGLDKLNVMTSIGPKQELLVITKDFKNISKYAKYDFFRIDNEDEGYKLKELGKFVGNATNGLKYHLGQKFTTKDVDNDTSDKNCAKSFSGAWWFGKCYMSHLFGKYLLDKEGDGIQWNELPADRINLRYTEMLIRPIQ